MTVTVVKRSSGGYTVTFGSSNPEYLSELKYATSGDSVRLVGPLGILNIRSYPPEEWTIGEETGFTTNAQVADALDGLIYPPAPVE